MPGIIPSFASSRKQMRHISNSRIYPCFRPHLKQRRTTRDANFGFLSDRTNVDVFAINEKCSVRASDNLSKRVRLSQLNPYFLKGNPTTSKNFLVSAGFLTDVTTEMPIPKTSLISSSLVSGKITCSLIPSE